MHSDADRTREAVADREGSSHARGDGGEAPHDRVASQSSGSRSQRQWSAKSVARPSAWRLLPPAIEEFVPPGHPAHFGQELVREELDLSETPHASESEWTFLSLSAGGLHGEAGSHFLRDFIDAACGRALQAGPRMLPAWLHGAAARLASSLLVVLTAAPRADGACNATCRRDIARCMATQCARVGREACRRRCKPVAIRTLAYVVSECRMDAAGLVTRQALRIRRGDREPITVAEFGPTDAIPDPSGVCRGLADGRWGGQWVQYGALQRLGVSPDGSGVVFEVTDEFSPFPPLLLLSPEQKGFFFVRADGRGRPRRLGPASRDRTFRSGGFSFAPPMPFSPNGRRIAFTDLGSGPGREEAVQIVVLDLAADQPTPTQVTHLPSGTAPGNFFDDFFLTCCPTFIDDETVVFQTFTDPDGSNPEHDLAAFKVRIDGTNLKRISLPVAVEGSRVVPTLGVLGRGTDLLRLPLPGTPVSPPTTPPTDFPITEVFVQSGKNLLLQLTKFRRADTFIGFLNPTHTRAFFLASAPSRANPHANCQLFSIGTNGSGLRQITHFGGTNPFIPGCFTTGFFLPRACGIGYGYYRVVIQDPLTRAVVFDSSCDPLGANPFGDQVFAMRPDGHGLRQLTDASGFTTNPDGSIRVELPGPFAYSAGLP